MQKCLYVPLPTVVAVKTFTLISSAAGGSFLTLTISGVAVAFFVVMVVYVFLFFFFIGENTEYL